MDSVTDESTVAGAATVNAQSQEIVRTMSCLQEALMSQAAGPATTQDLYASILDLQKQLTEEEEAVRIAQRRLDFTTEKTVGYYESWFPIGRPLKPLTVAICTGIALFFAIFIALMLLQMVGVDVAILLPKAIGAAAAGQRGAAGSLLSRFPLSFWVVLVILVIVFIYYRK